MALKKIATRQNGALKAEILRDAEWQEYRVRFYAGPIYQAGADYHTDDKSDALETAAAWCKNG